MNSLTIGHQDYQIVDIKDAVPLCRPGLIMSTHESLCYWSQALIKEDTKKVMTVDCFQYEGVVD